MNWPKKIFSFILKAFGILQDSRFESCEPGMGMRRWSMVPVMVLVFSLAVLAALPRWSYYVTVTEARTTPGYSTMVSISNDDSTYDMDVLIELYDKSGSWIESYRVLVPPNGTVKDSLNNLLGVQFDGKAIIRSNKFFRVHYYVKYGSYIQYSDGMWAVYEEVE